MNVDDDSKAALGARSRHTSRTSTHCQCGPTRYPPALDAEQKRTLEEIIPVDSVSIIAKHLLESEHFFRLTIDLKRVKFVQPLLSRVEQDDDFVASVSLSYLTAPLFQSSEVFHAVRVSRNPKDPGELLISDGFCSFRFGDRLHWSGFTRLFLPPRPTIEGSTQSAAAVSVNDTGGAALPIFVRARQCSTERKSTTIGVASLTFESFLSPELPDLSQIPHSFYTNLVSFDPHRSELSGGEEKAPDKEGNCEGPSLRELPIFESLMRVPIITRESATITGVLTLGVAIDLLLSAAELSSLLSKALNRVTPIHPIRSCKTIGHSDQCGGEGTDSAATDGLDVSQSTPSTLQRNRCVGGNHNSEQPSQSCCKSYEPESTPSHGGRKRLHNNRRRLHTIQSGAQGLPPNRRPVINSESVQTSSFSFGGNSQNRHLHSLQTAGPPCVVPPRRQHTVTGARPESCSSSQPPSDEDVSTETLRRATNKFRHAGGTPTSMAAGAEQLLQCEMMLMKMAAEQQHTKFLEEMRATERKAEEKLSEVRAENQKLKNDNQSLERKVAELDKKLQELQRSLGSTSPRKRCTHTRETSRQVDRSVSCDPNRDEIIEELRRQNVRLQHLLLRQARTTGDYGPSTAYNDPFAPDPDTYGLERHVGLTRALTTQIPSGAAPTRNRAFPKTLFDEPVWQSYHRQQHLWGASVEMPRTATVRTGRPLPPPFNGVNNHQSRPLPAQQREVRLARDQKGVRSISPGELRRGEAGEHRANKDEVGRRMGSRNSRREELVNRKTAQPDCSRGRRPIALSDSSHTSEKVVRRKGRGRGTRSPSSVSSSPLSSRSRQLIAKHLRKRSG